MVDILILNLPEVMMKTSESLTLIGLFLAVVLVVVGGFVFHKPLEGPPDYYVAAREAKELINATPELVVIDLSRQFYAQGHIPGSVNYNRCALASSLETFDRNKSYLVYCHAFGAPLTSARIMLDAGFKNVYALRGNYGAWVDAGYPVEN